MSRTNAVFFIGFGGPEKSEDIMPFLEIVTRGRGIPKERLLDVAHHYEIIGGKSPINAITQNQASALQAQLAKTDTPWPVYVGNRNWHPFIEDTLRKMAADGIKQAIGFPTAAYRTEASWERYIKAVEEARKRVGGSAPKIEYIEPWFDHPLFIEAICERIKEVVIHTPSPLVGEGRDGGTPPPQSRQTSGESPVVWRPPSFARGEEVKNVAWVFTAHSIPTPMAQASRYVQELRQTADLVATKFGKKHWTLAYTSRSGAPSDPWLEPAISDTIRELAREDYKDILAIPMGFVADHVEVLFDLDVEAKASAEKVGVQLHRAKTVGDHPLFIQMIADVIRKAHYSSDSFSK